MNILILSEIIFLTQHGDISIIRKLYNCTIPSEIFPIPVYLSCLERHNRELWKILHLKAELISQSDYFYLNEEWLIPHSYECDSADIQLKQRPLKALHLDLQMPDVIPITENSVNCCKSETTCTTNNLICKQITMYWTPTQHRH